MPIAIVIGCAPVVTFTGPQKLAIDMDEMGVAGALAGEPIRTVKCVTVDLEVPADAEIVIEGLIDPELLEPEGPFGESHGYVALEDFNMSMQVTAITHKKKPVFVSIISQVTPSESSVIKRVAYEPMFLSHLRDQLGIKGIRRGVAARAAVQRAAGDLPAVRAGRAAHRGLARAHGASGLRADCGKIVVAVSEDIDPTNTDAVFWSMAYRANPVEDVHVVPHRAGGHGPKSGRARNDSSHADRRDAEGGRSRRSRCRSANTWSARARSGTNSACRALSPQPPWHGYTLGDWNDTWETYAKRAVTGGWEQSGKETLAQKRGGLKPETPVRDAGQRAAGEH